MRNRTINRFCICLLLLVSLSTGSVQAQNANAREGSASGGYDGFCIAFELGVLSSIQPYLRVNGEAFCNIASRRPEEVSFFFLELQGHTRPIVIGRIARGGVKGREAASRGIGAGYVRVPALSVPVSQEGVPSALQVPKGEAFQKRIQQLNRNVLNRRAEMVASGLPSESGVQRGELNKAATALVDASEKATSEYQAKLRQVRVDASYYRETISRAAQYDRGDIQRRLSLAQARRRALQQELQMDEESINDRLQY